METINITNMQNHRLLASAAVFRCMHASGLDQYDVLANFIVATISLAKFHTFRANECVSKLKEYFSFDIPEAVVKRCIRAKLKQQFTLANRVWSRTAAFIEDAQLEDSLHEEQQQQDFLREQLIQFVENKKNQNLTEDEKNLLKDDFNSFLKISPVRKSNEPFIAAFVLYASEQPLLNNILKNMWEGLFIFEGLRYSAQGSEAVLSRDLYLYLDTEVLFNAAGYHGALYKRLFDEFNALVKEVNTRPSSSSGRIYLKYFDDTAREINQYFSAAEAIIERRIAPEPHKQAMVHIVNGCASSTDVYTKKAKFDVFLAHLKITQAVDQDYYDPPDYNVESEGRMMALARILNCDPERALQILKQFTKINWLRKGRSNVAVSAVGHFLVSGRSLTKQAAFSSVVKSFMGNGLPFSTDLDFLTENLWLRLNKGFSSTVSIPSSFDAVTRTRLVLASHLNDAVEREYRNLEKNKSSFTPEELGHLVSTIRSIKQSPEDINCATLDLDLDLIASEDFASSALEERAILLQDAEDGKRAAEELKIINAERMARNNYLEDELKQAKSENLAHKLREQKRLRLARREFNKKILITQKRSRAAVMLLYWTIPITVPILAGVGLIGPNDTGLAFYGIVLAVLFGVSTLLLVYWKGFTKWVGRVSRKRTRGKIRTANRDSYTPPGHLRPVRTEPSL